MSYLSHALAKNRNGLEVDAETTLAACWMRTRAMTPLSSSKSCAN